MQALRLSVTMAALIGWAAAAQAANLAPEDAQKHVGEDATVCGTVAGAKYAAQSKGGPTFIDFGKPYPDAIFTALILGTDRAKFGTPEKDIQGKQVCVTGKIRLYQGKPEIILTDPKQLTGK
jgi:nuclease S1